LAHSPIIVWGREDAMAAARIAPCLWFDHQAEEAARFYVSVFKNARITAVTRYSDAGQEIHRRPAGSVMTMEFELDAEGQVRAVLAGGCRPGWSRC
jgi:predicted 3-demethylubiquinone-9 3-methyltransferase (glyoxalase superfamily)